MGLLDELITDYSTISAWCANCPWHLTGVGSDEITAVLQEADEHIKLGHSVKADVDP